mgnify:CR=1 FL=1
MKNSNGLQIIESSEFQGSGYPGFAVLVYQNPASYYQVDTCLTNTNDTTPDVIIEEILSKYAPAWKELADL